MTYNEIIKDFEKVIVFHEFTSSVSKTLRNTLDLINRQKAEIERQREYIELLDIEHEAIRIKAIKEFAEELINRYSTTLDEYYGEVVWTCDIDELVKEMAGADGG